MGVGEGEVAADQDVAEVEEEEGGPGVLVPGDQVTHELTGSFGAQAHSALSIMNKNSVC